MFIIGHKKIIQYFERALEVGMLSHAYLFVGPKHVGKTTVARFLVEKLLNKDIKNRILENRNTVDFWQRPNPDIHWVSLEEGKKEIAIEQVRNLRTTMYQTPFVESHKIAIIEQTEKLSNAAANALLKTLEEPPGTSLFILIATQIDNLPETIASRCQVINFKRVAQSEILTALEENKVKYAKDKARLAGGLPGVALSWVEDEDGYQHLLDSARNFVVLLSQDVAEKFAFIESLFPKQTPLVKQAHIAQEMLIQWISILRDALLLKSEVSDIIINVHCSKEIEEIVKNLDFKTISTWHRKVQDTQQLVRMNVSPRLALENLFLQLTY